MSRLQGNLFCQAQSQGPRGVAPVRGGGLKGFFSSSMPLDPYSSKEEATPPVQSSRDSAKRSPRALGRPQSGEEDSKASFFQVCPWILILVRRRLRLPRSLRASRAVYDPRTPLLSSACPASSSASFLSPPLSSCFGSLDKISPL